MGRPPYLTPEQREASRIRQNKKRSARSLTKKKAERAARAIAEGREPGKAGMPRRLTDDQRTANRRETIRKNREKHRDEILRRDNDRHKARVAKRAIAAGREPGKVGAVRRLTAEEFVARQRARSLAYWERHPERRRKNYESYYAATKDQHTVRSRNRRARKKGNGGKHSVADIRALWDIQSGKCAFCSQLLGEEKPHVDHWIPIARGGSNGPENLRLMHPFCNLKKGWKMPSDCGLPD